MIDSWRIIRKCINYCRKNASEKQSDGRTISSSMIAPICITDARLCLGLQVWILRVNTTLATFVPECLSWCVVHPLGKSHNVPASVRQTHLLFHTNPILFVQVGNFWRSGFKGKKQTFRLRSYTMYCTKQLRQTIMNRRCCVPFKYSSPGLRAQSGLVGITARNLESRELPGGSLSMHW